MKKKWMAGYSSSEDWYLCLATEENEQLYEDLDGDYYDSFSAAKKALLDTIRERISDHKYALRHIKKIKKADRERD